MTDYSNIRVVLQPSTMKIKLFPHQLASIYQMEKFEIDNKIVKDNYIKETKIGVNADLVGFGKTASMIGLIVRDKMEWDIELPFVFETISTHSRGLIKNYSTKRFTKLPTTLILVSQSIIGQWEKELKETELKVSCIKTRKDLENVSAEEFDVILVTPTMYNTLTTIYKDYAWKRFIFDEPGHMKIVGMNELYANFYWLVTSTPNSIVTLYRNCKKNFIKDIISHCYRDFEYHFGDIILRNDPEFVRASFEMPPVNYFTHECYQPMFNAIQNYVHPRIRTMIEAGNIEGAIMNLGGQSTDNIIELVKNKKQEELISIDYRIELYTMRNDQATLEIWKTKRDHILEQIKDIDDKFKNMLEDNCVICYDTLDKPILEPNCQNLFCGKCFLDWIKMKNTCPMCRSVIDITKLIYIDTNTESTKNVIVKEEQKLTKTDKIVDIIKKNMSGKFLIFSEYDDTFYPISQSLKDNNIKFLQIKGNIKTREKTIDLFKHGMVPVIFLNSNFNAAGINLQETTDIILYHDMDQNTKDQIIGRAARVGRTFELNVHYLT